MLEEVGKFNLENVSLYFQNVYTTYFLVGILENIFWFQDVEVWKLRTKSMPFISKKIQSVGNIKPCRPSEKFRIAN